MTGKIESQTALGATIEARIADILRGSRGAEIARTLVETPGTTIRPSEMGRISTRGDAAVDALRSLGGSLDGKIELHRTLGEGGMGIVHLATQATVGRHVAVKTLRSGVATPDATLRILREAWVTGTLEHPNVVPIYDVGIDASGAPIIVMKRIEGQHWGELIHATDEIARRFPAVDPVEWNLEILGSVCNAVHFAHSRGILHRDLKPENVMIGAFGEVYVLDWGIAVSLNYDATGRLPLAESATDVAGTPSYMAPEMLLGDPSKLSVRTDVYLLGAVLYEIFVGRPPHEGRDLHEMVTHILSSPITFPDDVPEELVEICAKAMSRDPELRHESADAFRRAVDEYLRHCGSRRLAADASRSHELLEVSLKREAHPTRAHEIARLLGECRFGYRAAIAAWPENLDARVAHDNALLSVLEHTLALGDTTTSEALLRELEVKPPEVALRVEAAVKAHREHEERLHKLEVDHDASVGGRTRSLLAVLFGALWTTSPLMAWAYVERVGAEPALLPAFAPLSFLVLGSAAFVWARETLTKTLYNRHLIATASVYLTAQCLLGIGGMSAGLSPYHVHLMSIYGWGLLYAILAVWAEPWFAFVAVTCAVSFIVAARIPGLIFPLMSLDNLVFTIVVVRAWLPKGDIARFREQSQRMVREHHARHHARLK